MKATVKPHLPKNFQWSHPLGDHVPLHCTSDAYTSIASDFLKNEGTVETLRRQYVNRRCVVGVSFSERTVVMEVLNTKALYPKHNDTPTPNVLRFVYFLCTAEGIHQLDPIETRSVRCGQPDVFTHRLLKETEIAVMRNTIRTHNALTTTSA